MRPLRPAVLCALAGSLAASLVALASAPASADQFTDWTVVASANGLTATATAEPRGSLTVSAYTGCKSWETSRVNGVPVFTEVCGTWYATTEAVTGSVDTKPSTTNCTTSPYNSETFCRRLDRLTVKANDQENLLFLSTHEGTPGYAVEADLGAGNDLVDVGGPGSWSFEGGAGTDMFSPSRPYDAEGERRWEQWTIDLDTGTAVAAGLDGAPAITQPVTLTGFEDVSLSGDGDGDDQVRGNAAGNRITTAGGDDVLEGRAGGDRLESGNGLDVVRGGDGGDEITSRDGDDRLEGGSGDDSITDDGAESSYPDGLPSDDTIDGGPGDDTISSGAGDDEITGGPGADDIRCGPGDDTVTDAEPIDTIADDCERVSEGLDIDLTPYDADGQLIEGVFAPGQEVLVEAEPTNNTGQTLDDFEFEGGDLMTVDPRSPGGLVLIETDVDLADDGLVLPDGASRTVWYRLTATDRGLAATNSRITAQNEDDEEESAQESLRVDIEDGQVVDEVVGRWVLLQAVDRYLMKMYDDWMAALEKRAARLRAALSKHLTAAQRTLYFGLDKGLEITQFETLQALLRNMPDSAVASHLPNDTIDGHTVDELNAAYNDAFLDEVGNGVAKWAGDWKKTGTKAKNAAIASYQEGLLASFYFLGNATPQERMEFEARMIAFADNNTTSKNNLISMLKREIPKWRENGTYFAQAMDMSAKDVTLRSPDLQAQLKQESKWRENMLAQADKDPVRFQREWAKRDAEIFNLGMPLILDTLVGGAAQRVGAVKIGGQGSAVITAGGSAGVLKANGSVAKGPGVIAPNDVPSSLSGGSASRTTEEFLSNVDGATLVRADDFGNVYELPNVGGVPEITLDAKAGILGELQDEYTTATGRNIKLVEVLKPSSPIRKPGGVAKLELTEQKTGKPEMIDAGAPDAVLGEANLWRNTAHPSKQPGWGELPKARQDKAVAEWTKANERCAEWQDPAPGSKTARLQQCIGQEARVPLDPAPNAAGLQRFVTAEFEVVEVVQGTAEAKLIRVKKYVVEVVDTKSGKVVNGKTVVDEPVAAPQTPDADAVAVAKQKLDANGDPVFDSQGRPVVEPLSRAEREFVMQRYIDKNVKARRTGTMPDAAEHGVTLVMDDASAKAAGKLLPMYGAPFLPEGVGSDYLRRIAPYVKPKGVGTEEMYQRMLQLVQSEGGFGQHAVVITTDARYLGDLAVAAW